MTEDKDELDAPDISERRIKRQLYMEFLGDFKEVIGDYVKETVNQLCISEIPINGVVKLFDGLSHGMVKIKNQGETSCYLSTNGQCGFKLCPNESIEFYLNNQLFVTTVSGTTRIGFIRG